MKKILIAIITGYQKLLSPDKGVIATLFGGTKKTCIFYPTCSEYAKEAITVHGVRKGLLLGLKRIGRCNPWSEPRVDLVPEKR